MGKTGYYVILVSVLIVHVALCKQTTMQYSAIVDHLKTIVEPDVIPIPISGSGPLEVSVKLNLLNLLEVDRENNEVEVIIWQMLSWTSPAMGWDPAEYNNVTEARISCKDIWTPDFMVYNSVNKPEVITPKIAVVNSGGIVVYVPGIRLRFACDLYTVDSPSGANCTMKFGSWTYSSKLLTITGPEAEGGNFDLSEYRGHARYSILKTYARKDVKKYACCPESYEDLKFTMTIRDGGH